MSKTLTATTLCIALLATAGYASAQNLLTAADSGYNNLNSFLSGAGYVYSAAVSDGGSYAGISSTVGSGVNVLGSTATLVAGSNTSGSSTSVSMQWRNRAEVEQLPGQKPLPSYATHLVSDVVDLQGMTGVYALQMNYSPKRRVRHRCTVRRAKRLSLPRLA